MKVFSLLKTMPCSSIQLEKFTLLMEVIRLKIWKKAALKATL